MWYQLHIEICRPDEAEALSDALEGLGAVSVTLTDRHDSPVLEPEPGTTPLWPDIVIQALYTEEEAAAQAIKTLSPNYPHLRFSLDTLPEKDWERVWMDDFKPQRFGERLWICPSWIEPPQPDAVNLILDPGLAFGTGTHPTTSLCLSWLDAANLTRKSVIDYGCGSGILALAALKLGAASVQAVDIDEQALLATRNNADTNQMASMPLFIGFPDSLKPGADLLIANILLAPLLTLKDRFKALLTPGGQLVVSGLLLDQTPQMLQHYDDDFVHEGSHTLDGWSLLIFKRR
ncbi:50S ribosomal protein L11 methyltransferase [Legionella taurinensis]|uniref:Ribosomal protein L11 methyltransferase n=1 Tax=Legionella taurinensis TaxID=70611 RepID=A0A3A5L738_9GAMM|nr:50S ribosomal protein L11 methyltransferase [Legionella taurinensis]MDX1837675.1 50S ribosomal protein L11 methyltransferase [Legionella taurinensis]PUT39960.1 50S ribosomal protein L11 methyltransferase [Legionella taurinensis]PUT43726.1 50S ribosomal protein L11 methyltransferase [Legionella taurinensis]PUT46141.1 50S ribosomal protein L11 methyltransferase [Legionella taurinensis]PUT47881.1 50S ribosomal protein L11 methyltransferase [Legionella taurinensis]